MSTEAKIEKIEQIVRIASFRIKELRFLLVNQQLALKNIYKEAGDDWRTSRFVYAISSVQSMIYQIKAIVKRLLEINNTLLEEGTSINSSNGTFVNGKSVDCYSQNYWVTLKEPDDLPEQFSNNDRFIKQRTEKWFNKRKEFLLTGSKLYEGIGLDSLKSLQKQYDTVVRNIHIEEQILQEVKQRMEHGTKSEIHATATLTATILSFYCPDLKYIEEGASIVTIDEKPFILVSPDGSVGHVDIQQSDEKPFILVSPDGSVGHVDIQQSDEKPFILVSTDGSVGHVDIQQSDEKPFILVSPDGSVGHVDIQQSDEIPVPVYECEFKCPSPADYKTPVHYDIPIRYVLTL